MQSKHPQAPPFDNELEITDFLAKPQLARFCSHNPDGTIHAAPIYYLYKNGEFLFGTQVLSRKVKNIQHDPQVTVLIDAYEPVLQAVLAYGEAVLDFDDVVEKRVRILERGYDLTLIKDAHTTEDIELGGGARVTAAYIIADLNVVMKFISYPGRKSTIASAGDIVFAV